MKTFLLLAVGSVITMATDALPNLPAKLILGAFVLMAALAMAAREAPVGLEHESGFYLVHMRRPVTKGRAKLRLWPTRKKLLTGWLLSDSHQPAKA